jgi:predicted Fe-Mo cluster-binding NifX family protein
MKVALLTTQSRISPVFETTCSWVVININDDEYIIGSTYQFHTRNEIEMANELLIKGIQLLVCGAIPCYLEKQLRDRGCEVLSFIAGDIDEVIKALNGDLLENPKFKMPGCKKSKRRSKFFANPI